MILKKIIIIKYNLLEEQKIKKQMFNNLKTILFKKKIKLKMIMNK